jgi:hypothetical protein
MGSALSQNYWIFEALVQSHFKLGTVRRFDVEVQNVEKMSEKDEFI